MNQDVLTGIRTLTRLRVARDCIIGIFKEDLPDNGREQLLKLIEWLIDSTDYHTQVAAKKKPTKRQRT